MRDKDWTFMGSRGFSERERDFSWLRKEGSRVIVDLGLLAFLEEGRRG